MTPTPTEEDLRLAREWITTVENTQGSIPNAGRLAAKLAAFRAEARRERDAEWCSAIWPGNPEGVEAVGPSEGAASVKEGAVLAVQYAVQSEREACERIVEECTDWDWKAAILRRLRERAK